MAVVAAVGAVISATAAYSAGQGNKEISRYNAKVNRLQAIDALQQGKKDAQLIRQRASELKSSQRVGFAAQNIDVDVGSAALIQAETDYIAEIEVKTNDNNAKRAAWGYEVGATQTLAQGQLAASTGAANATGSLLSGMSNAYTMRSQVKAAETSP